MRTLSEEQLNDLNGGGWLADWGTGLACGLAIAATVTTGGAAVLVAIAACATAVG